MSEQVVEIEERPRERSLRDFYYVLFRHKRKSLLFFFVVIAVVALGTFTADEVYESEAKLLVKPGRESLAVDPTVPDGRIISVSRQMEEQLNSELEILKNRDLIEKVVDPIGPEKFLRRPDEGSDGGATRTRSAKNILRKVRAALRTIKAMPGNVLQALGITDVLEPREKAIQKVSKKLGVEALRKSNVIRLTFECQSPQLSKDTLDSLIQVYLEHHIQVHQTSGSFVFFKGQTESLHDQLEKSEEELRNLKSDTNIANLTEQRTALIQHLDELQRQKHHVEAQLEAALVKVSALVQVAYRPNYFLDDARYRLLELRLSEKKLLEQYSEDDRFVQNVRDQIKQVETMIAGEERGTLDALKKQRQILAEQITDTEEDLQVLNDNEIKLAQLERRRAIAEQNYSKYVDKLEETRISQALEREKISNIAVIQPATMPILPIKPKKTLNLLLGLFLGVFGALGLSLVSEYMDHSIKIPEDVEEKLQLPTLASIPRARQNVVHPALKRKGRSKRAAKVAKARSENWDIPKGLREYYDTFLEHLLNGSGGCLHGACAIGVIGCYRREGVSTVAANLATALSQNDDGRVLLVDMNTGHPSVHQIFGTRLAPGLTDALVASQNTGNGDSAFFHRAQNLDIITAGGANGSSRRTLKSEVLSEFLRSVKQDYRFVVIDMPALRADSSGIRLASFCDGVILVVEAERLRWEVADRAKEQLVRSGANILGVVLNKRPFPVPEWLYKTL